MKATVNRNPSRQNKTIQPVWGKGLSGSAIKENLKVNSLPLIKMFWTNLEVSALRKCFSVPITARFFSFFRAQCRSNISITINLLACSAGVLLERVSVTTLRPPSVHPLGRSFFLSPLFHCLKNSRWRRSHEKISPALQAINLFDYLLVLIQGRPADNQLKWIISFSLWWSTLLLQIQT